MKRAAISLVLAASAYARVISRRQDDTQQQLLNAVRSWQDDTDEVSSFLDLSVGFDQSSDNFASLAIDALGQEKDELKHKATIEQLVGIGSTSCSIGNDQCLSVTAANDTLVADGTFQSVVNLLQDMSNNGLSAIGAVDKINNGHDGIGGRCGSVLPAIDEYFLSASEFLQQNFNDNSLVGQQAIRPKACNFAGQTVPTVAQLGLGADP